MFERFTAGARRAVVAAQQEARSRQHRDIGTEHLLLGILGEAPDDSAVATLADLGISYSSTGAALDRLTGAADLDASALESIGIDLAVVRQRIADQFGADAFDRTPDQARPGRFRRLLPEHLPFTPEAKRALEGALRAALARSERQLTGVHLLLGVLSAGGLGRRLLESQGVEPADVSAALGRPLPRSA